MTWTITRTLKAAPDFPAEHLATAQYPESVRGILAEHGAVAPLAAVLCGMRVGQTIDRPSAEFIYTIERED